MSQEDIFIVNGARTPMGAFQGDLASKTAIDLGATAIEAAVSSANISKEEVCEVLMGNVLSAGLKQGPARQAARQAGIPDKVGCTTINKLCGSGMKATMLAHDTIRAGSAQVIIAGGMESMTNAPYLLLNARGGYRMGHGDQVMDHMFFDGLEDASTGVLMGGFAQEMADKKGISREEMDQYAIRSLERARAATESGKLKDEIVPITVKSRKEESVIDQDEQPYKVSIEKIPSLRPVFAKDGTVTAANSSSISDGASALVLANEQSVKRLGLNPQARLVGHAGHAQHPSEFTCAPIGAIQRLFEKTGWTKDDVDVFEINEAFAMVAMMPIKALELDDKIVNIFGGACAQGHPVGSTGSRIIVTLINALKKTGGKRGVAALCIGGGEATAMAIELC